MATFKEYTLKDGTKKWMFKTYLGIDPLTGKQIQTTGRGFKTQRLARLAAARVQTEFETDIKKKEVPKTYRDVYHSWMKEYEKTVVGSTLLKTERIFKNHILDEFGDIYISEITPIKIQEVMDAWSKKYSTASKMINYTGLVFKYAIRFGYIDRNPVDAIIKPKAKKHKRDTELFYDKKELKLFFSELEKSPNLRAKTFFRLLAMTGMRKQEAAALQWNDINFRAKTINIDKAITRTAAGLEVGKTKTVGSNRIISIDNKTLVALILWIVEQNPTNDSDLIFGTESNSIMGLDTPRKWLLAIQNRMDETAGKKLPRITTHGFRHTHVSLLVEMGATLKQVQDRLGHDDAQTTMNIYAHVSKSSREQLADTFNKFIDF
ncbi:site-specific integrase [Enterococcus massiliensis]|uniref:site-specific integrase n=1 Tax=Enterococcus massiliensis TaxID=1640685 RepID=UPI00065E6C4F|nr:tyrosine-type recombinase/integrase [Enterococcus massiliensis]